MVVAVIIAVMLAVVGIVLVEVTGPVDGRNEFVFALLDRVVSDESPVSAPTTHHAQESFVRHAA